VSIQHTVVFRLAPTVDEAEFLAAARAALVPIPGVTEFTVARQVSPSSDLRIRFSMVFADRSAYEGYTAHPDHVAFVRTRWEADVEAFQEYDFTDLQP
jgi:hypothetical protein